MRADEFQARARRHARAVEALCVFCALVVLAAMFAGTAIPEAPYVLTSLVSGAVTMHLLVDGSREGR